MGTLTTVTAIDVFEDTSNAAAVVQKGKIGQEWYRTSSCRIFLYGNGEWGLCITDMAFTLMMPGLMRLDRFIIGA
jgi:hypothetical protein